MEEIWWNHANNRDPPLRMESRRCGLGLIYELETIQLTLEEFTDLGVVLKVTTVKVFWGKCALVLVSHLQYCCTLHVLI